MHTQLVVSESENGQFFLYVAYLSLVYWTILIFFYFNILVIQG